MEFSNDWLNLVHSRVYNQSGYRIALLGANTLSGVSTMAEYVRSLLLPGTGAGLKEMPVTYSSPTYDVAQDRSEYSASFLTTQHSTSLTFFGIAQFENRPFSVAGGLRDVGWAKVISIASDVITTDPLLPLDLPTNTPVMLRTNGTGTLPGTLVSAGQPVIAYAVNVTDIPGTRTFQLALTPGGAAVSLAGNSGSLIVYNAAGAPMNFESLGTVSVPANQPITIALAPRLGDALADLIAL